jgi:putative selenium metabolism hydrolase
MEGIYKRILALAEEYRDYTADNLSKLVRIKSLSTEERDVQAELMRQMEEAGFDEVFTDGFGNVIGRIGNGKKIVAIDGHLDTVDIGSMSNWSFDPLGGEIRDGFVHGRGTADQKGGVASFVTAGRILKELGFSGDVSLYFTGTVIEEDCEGLCWKHIIEEDGIRPELVIITEPTGLKLNIGQRGRMEMQVNFSGRSSHGSAPERGENAIYMASRTALEIEKLNHRLVSDEFLGKGSITVTEVISQSPSLCAVPDYARLHLDRRLTAGETRESAVTEIEQLIKGINAKVVFPVFSGKSFTGLEIVTDKYYPAWKMDAEHEYVQQGIKVFNDLFSRKPLIDRWLFSTNGVMTCGIYGIPTIGFGPGEESMAHAPNEKVAVNELVAASAFYAALVLEIVKK